MKKILFFGLLTCFLTIGCTKDKDSAKSSTNCKITQIDEIFAGDPSVHKTFYTLDNNGKVTRVDWDTKPSIDFLSYTYQTDKIIVAASGSVGASYNATYTLSNGLVSKFVSKNQTTDFTYSTDGYLIKAVTIAGTTPDTYTLTYTNGNLSQIDRKLGLNPIGTTTISYGTELYKNALGYDNGLLINDNLLQEAGDWGIISAGYFGKASKNLAIGYSSSITGIKAGSLTYSKDSKGNLSTMTETLTTGGINKATFVYSCN